MGLQEKSKDELIRAFPLAVGACGRYEGSIAGVRILSRDGQPFGSVRKAINAAHNSTTTTFYSRLQAPYNASCSDPASGTLPFCEFDDVVAMISPSMLVARMVSAGRLP